MAEIHDSTTSVLIPFEIKTLRGATRDLTFNIYLKLSDTNTACIFSVSSGLDYKRLTHYVQKGVKELYIRSEDVEAYRLFIANSADAIFNNPKSSQEKKIAALLNITEQNISEIFGNFAVSDESAQVTTKLIKNYIHVMTESPKTLSLLLKLVSHGEYLYYHSIAVSVFSMFIARGSGQFSQRMLEILGQGGFLHDIGMIQIPKEIVCNPGPLSESEMRTMQQHSQIGLQMLEGAKSIPDEVRYIVYQHHEEPSGKGYPNGLRGGTIYYPAKIVAIADALSSLLSNRPNRPGCTIEKALETLKQETGKYDRDLLKIVEQVFVVK